MLINLANKIEEIEIVHQKLQAYLSGKSIDEDDSKKISITADEILSNIIYYGFEDQLEHRISLQLTVTDQTIILEFIDDGKYFNPLEYIQQNNYILQEDKAGGLGLGLVYKLAKSMYYNRIENKNKLTLSIPYQLSNAITE